MALGNIGKLNNKARNKNIMQTTIGTVRELDELAKREYSDEEIKEYDINEAIMEHPLSHKATNVRSKLAYKALLDELKPTGKYLLPGQICCFHYDEPKYKEELEYYDKTPLVIFFGLVRTKDNVIREIGLNLHYYPPFARAKVIKTVYGIFKDYYDKQFNKAIHKPNAFINWNILQSMLKRNARIAFGVKMYIPVLRGASYIVPTRLLATAAYTEGHFSNATLMQIQHFWRTFKG